MVSRGKERGSIVPGTPGPMACSHSPAPRQLHKDPAAEHVYFRMAYKDITMEWAFNTPQWRQKHLPPFHLSPNSFSSVSQKKIPLGIPCESHSPSLLSQHTLAITDAKPTVSARIASSQEVSADAVSAVVDLPISLQNHKSPRIRHL